MIEVIGSHSYRLDTPPGIHNVFHSQLLRLAASEHLPSQKQDDTQPPPQIVGQDEEWEIEEIINEKVVRRGRGRKNTRRFLVKWVNYARPTWEPYDALEDTAALERWEGQTNE